MLCSLGNPFLLSHPDFLSLNMRALVTGTTERTFWASLDGAARPFSEQADRGQFLGALLASQLHADAGRKAPFGANHLKSLSYNDFLAPQARTWDYRLYQLGGKIHITRLLLASEGFIIRVYHLNFKIGYVFTQHKNWKAQGRSVVKMSLTSLFSAT